MPQPVLDPNSLCQVAIVVPDIGKAAAAFAAILGMPVPQVHVTDGQEQAHTRYLGRPTPARARLAFFRLGPISLELIEPIDSPSTWADQLASHGPSLHHIAFNVGNMDQTVADLEARGLKEVQRGDFAGGCYSYLDGISVLGTTVELLARK